MRRMILLVFLLAAVLPGRMVWAADRLITSETLVDNFNNSHTLYLFENNNNFIKTLSYSAVGTSETRKLFTSHDNIVNFSLIMSNGNLLASWETEFGARRDAYLAISLDGGEYFSRPKLVGDIPPLVPPTITRPADGDKQATARISFSPNNTDPLLCRLEISAAQNFPSASTWIFEELLSPVTLESYNYQFPIALPDGWHYARINASNGLVTSPYSRTVSFALDSTTPTLTTLEAARQRNILKFYGRASEFPAGLAVNKVPVAIESDSTFSASFELTAGANSFTFSLSDEAGNTNITTREFYFNPASPEIEIFQPDDNSWFKESAALLIIANVFDLQGDVAEDCPARVLLEGKTLDCSLAYDPEEKQLSGIVNLPPALSEGRHTASLIIEDRRHNTGTALVNINIDKTPPRLNLADQQCYAKSLRKISIPVVENGAGIDPTGTLITIAGISAEANSTNEAGALVVKPRYPLKEGTYEASITARDRIGNLGVPDRFTLVIDITPPGLTLLTTPESLTTNREITIAGMTTDQYPDSVTIYDNARAVVSFKLAQPYFESRVQLVPGRNELKIESRDKAGNKTTLGLNVTADLVGGLALVSSLANGPNPFDPNSQTHYFTYNLTAPGAVKVYVFNLTGNCLWTKSANSTAAGALSWDGRDNFGRLAANGVYPFVFVASVDGANEIKRGQIIVFQ